MGIYDIENKYCEKYDVRIVALCHELMDEYEAASELDAPALDTFRDKFKNHDESGLMDKLKKNLNFDIESAAGSSASEKFDMLKILKELYYIEKVGDPKYKLYSNKVRVQITDILAKPRLANISTDFSETTVYGNIFDNLYNRIKNVVDDADDRCMRLEKMNARWEYVTERIFDYVATDKALQEPEKATAELRRIYKFLKEKVLVNLPQKDTVDMIQSEGVMKTFFNILACHRLMCNEVDRIKINYQICLSEPPDQRYVSLFKKYQDCMADWELVSFATNCLSGKNDNQDAQIALWFFSYGMEISDDDIKHYKYAIEKSRVVALWISQFKRVDFIAGVPLNLLSTIVQEIVSVKKQGDEIENDYYGYKNRYKSMLAAVKNPEMADSVVLWAWIKRLENRTAVNYGAHDQIRLKRDIESVIYEIKTVIFSYQNLEEMEFVNEVLFHFVARSIMSKESAIDRWHCFTGKVMDNLQGVSAEVRFTVGLKINVLNMFKEFMVDIRNDIEDIVAADVAMLISKFYDEESVGTTKSIWHKVEICYGENHYRQFLLQILIDRVDNQIIYNEFFEVRSDADTDRMVQLGLTEFVKKSNKN